MILIGIKTSNNVYSIVLMLSFLLDWNKVATANALVFKNSDGNLIIICVYYPAKTFNTLNLVGVPLEKDFVNALKGLYGMLMKQIANLTVLVWKMHLAYLMEVLTHVNVCMIMNGMKKHSVVKAKGLMLCWLLSLVLVWYVNICFYLAVGGLANVVYVVIKKKLSLLSQMSQVAPEPTSLVMW